MRKMAWTLAAVAVADLSFAAASVAVRYDDNKTPEEWREVAAQFESAGLRCSFAVCSGLLTPEQGQCLRELQGRGFEIMDHTSAHAMFEARFLDEDDFAAVTNRPFVAEAFPAERRILFHPELDLAHPNNVRFCGSVRAGVLSCGDEAAAKRLTWSKKVWISSRKRLYGITVVDGRRFLRDFWCRTVEPFDVSEEEMTLVHQIAIQPCEGLLELQAWTTRRNFAVRGLNPPTVWIQPGGWEAFVDARRLKDVYAKWGYVGADCVMPRERCWSAADDPTPKELVRWMLRPSFRYFDEGASFEDVVAQVELADRRQRPLVFISHQSSAKCGGRAKWLALNGRFVDYLKTSGTRALTMGGLVSACLE